jgi:hypothetical protein
MDFECLVPSNEGKFYPIIQNNPSSIDNMLKSRETHPFYDNILTNMAANNSIIKIEATNELIGDPM